MRRPLTRYIAAFLLVYTLVGALYLFGLFDLNVSGPSAGENGNSPSHPIGIKMKKATADSYSNNGHDDMDDQLMVEYELEDEPSTLASTHNLALGASLKWKKTLLECSRAKKDLRTAKSQLLSQDKGISLAFISPSQ